ncbi:uncharacterized protein LOC135819879 [Sycon ciliatum]|uniref:uncharacterized protein LOC135819879 n=1 Tax=Sycon ciliatum TaxID=27933 RepID=UPI0031F6A085
MRSVHAIMRRRMDHPMTLSCQDVFVAILLCSSCSCWLLFPMLLGVHGTLDAPIEHYRGPVGADPDIVIGAMLDISEWDELSMTCVRAVTPRNARTSEIISYMIQRANADPSILPNVTLGFDITDVCGSEHIAVHAGVEYVAASGHDQCAANNSGGNAQSLVAVVLSPNNDRVTLATTSLLNLFSVPVVSYGASDPGLSNDCEFPYFTRNVASDVSKMTVVLHIMQYMNWNYLTVVHPGNKASQSVVDDLQSVAAMTTPPICVSARPEFVVTATVAAGGNGSMDRLVRALYDSLPILANGQRSNLVWLLSVQSSAVLGAFLDSVERLTDALNATEPVFRFLYDDNVFVFVYMGSREHIAKYAPLMNHSVGLGPLLTESALNSSVLHHIRRLSSGGTNTTAGGNPWYSGSTPGSDVRLTAFETLAADAVQAIMLALNRTLQQMVDESDGRYSSMADVARSMRASRRRIDAAEFQQQITRVSFTSNTTEEPVRFTPLGELQDNTFELFTYTYVGMTVEFETSATGTANCGSHAATSSSSDCSAMAGGNQAAAGVTAETQGICTSSFNVTRTVLTGLETARFNVSGVREFDTTRAFLHDVLGLGASSSSSLATGEFRAVCSLPCQPGEKAVVMTTRICCWTCVQCEQDYYSTSVNSPNCTECDDGYISNSDRTGCDRLPLYHLAITGSYRFIVYGFSGAGLLLALPILISALVWCRRKESIRWSVGTSDMTVLSLAGSVLALALSPVEIQEPSDVLCALLPVLVDLCLMLAVVPILASSIQRFAELHRLRKYELSGSSGDGDSSYESSNGPSTTAGGGKLEQQMTVMGASAATGDVTARRHNFANMSGASLSVDVFEPPAEAETRFVGTATSTLSLPAPHYNTTLYIGAEGPGGVQAMPRGTGAAAGTTTTATTLGVSGHSRRLSASTGAIPETTSTGAMAARRTARQSIGHLGKKVTDAVRRRRRASTTSLTSILTSPKERLIFCLVVLILYIVLHVLGLLLYQRSQAELSASGHTALYLICSPRSILSEVATAVIVALASVLLIINLLNHGQVRRAHIKSSLDITSSFMCMTCVIVYFLDSLVFIETVQTQLYTPLFPAVFAFATVIIVHVPKFASHWRHAWLSSHDPHQLEVEQDRAEVMETMQEMATPNTPRRLHRSFNDLQVIEDEGRPTGSPRRRSSSHAGNTVPDISGSPRVPGRTSPRSALQSDVTIPKISASPRVPGRSPNRTPTSSTSSAPPKRSVTGQFTTSVGSSTSSAPADLMTKGKELPIPRIHIAMTASNSTTTSGYVSSDRTSVMTTTTEDGVAAVDDSLLQQTPDMPREELGDKSEPSSAATVVRSQSTSGEYKVFRSRRTPVHDVEDGRSAERHARDSSPAAQCLTPDRGSDQPRDSNAGRETNVSPMHSQARARSFTSLSNEGRIIMHTAL